MNGWNDDPRKHQWLVTAAKAVEILMCVGLFLALPFTLAYLGITVLCEKLWNIYVKY